MGAVGGCRSALIAYQVPIPKAEEYLTLACLHFNEYLSPHDFVPAPAGQWVQETAGNIYCPWHRCEAPYEGWCS